MSQVSPPLRILLVAAIAFLAAWMLFLRPGPEELPSTPVTPAVTSGGGSAAGDAVAGANAASAQADAQAGALADGTAATTAPGTAVGAPAAPATQAATGEPVEVNPQALARLPRDVARAVRRDKVVALLFWNSEAPEDRRVRRSLRSANTYGDKVFVKAASVRDISRYAPITRGVDVQQSPTVVIVDADLHAESLVGYVARTTIRQALSDALRAGR